MVEAFSEVSETSPDVAAGYLNSLASMAMEQGKKSVLFKARNSCVYSMAY